MTKKYKILIADNQSGTYLPIAIQFAKYFEKVGYYCVQQSPFPKLSLSKIGTGYSQITKEDNFWSIIDNYDLFFFPDLYFTDWAEHLKQMDKNVIGGAQSEQIETDRHLFKQLLERAGLPSAPTQIINGTTNLRQYLKNPNSNDSYIKISTFRNEMETFHHINFNQSEIFLNELENKLGPLKEQAEFIVEKSIDAICETGIDTYTVNGKYPQNNLYGIEIKDAGYLGKQSQYNQLPKPVQQVCDKFAPILKSYGHNSFFSSEIRYSQNGISYFTDPTMRVPSPPGDVLVRIIDNWPDIMMGLAQGKIVEPNFIAEYGCQIILKSPYANTNFLPIIFPHDFTDNINLKCSFIVDGKSYIIPICDAGYDMLEVGSVVVIGDIMDDVINRAVEIAKTIDGYQLTFDSNVLEKAKDEIQKLETDLDITF